MEGLISVALGNFNMTKLVACRFATVKPSSLGGDDNSTMHRISKSMNVVVFFFFFLKCIFPVHSPHLIMC